MVYHHGKIATSGHYTTTIKSNDQWFLVNDRHVYKNPRFTTAPVYLFCPYLIVYEKACNAVLSSDGSVLEPLTSMPISKNQTDISENDCNMREAKNPISRMSFNLTLCLNYILITFFFLPRPGIINIFFQYFLLNYTIVCNFC